MRARARGRLRETPVFVLSIVSLSLMPVRRDVVVGDILEVFMQHIFMVQVIQVPGKVVHLLVIRVRLLVLQCVLVYANVFEHFGHFAVGLALHIECGAATMSQVSDACCGLASLASLSDPFHFEVK